VTRATETDIKTTIKGYGLIQETLLQHIKVHSPPC